MVIFPINHIPKIIDFQSKSKKPDFCFFNGPIPAEQDKRGSAIRMETFFQFLINKSTSVP
jgi:hypothetical protein